MSWKSENNFGQVIEQAVEMLVGMGSQSICESLQLIIFTVSAEQEYFIQKLLFVNVQVVWKRRFVFISFKKEKRTQPRSL